MSRIHKGGRHGGTRGSFDPFASLTSRATCWGTRACGVAGARTSTCTGCSVGVAPLAGTMTA
eukprot:7484924-Pyramimonas_sp.AAC.1